jgi:hypothetical protein
MRRTIALLVGAAAVLVVAARPVAAAPDAPANGAAQGSVATTSAPANAVPADAVDLTLSQVVGSGLAVTLDSGASEEHDIVVSNHTANLRLTVKLTATDATGRLGAAAASWLAFGDDAIQLDPHAAVTVPMTIAVPHDTQPGSALAHVSATVESAVSAADGSPVAGTASRTFPVSISVRGTATAQIAIADVHRIDQGSTHQLAVVLRNFGDQGAQVSGHVRVAGDEPQTLSFHADLAPSRDTTLDLPWKAPPAGSTSDLAVDVEYGAGNVASWSSRLGGPPTDLSGQSGAPTTTPATSIVGTGNSPADAGLAAAKPWWKQPWAMALGVLALLGALSWFGFEMTATRRRPGGVGTGPARYDGPAGWDPANDDSVALSRQLVRLTEVIVELIAAQRESWVSSDDRARARSPGPPVAPAEGEALFAARAGPAPPAGPGPPDGRDHPPSGGDVPTNLPKNRRDAELDAISRSASSTPGDSARREAVTTQALPNEEAVEAHFVDDEPPATEVPATGTGAETGPADGSAALIQRLVELDRRRRELRSWMDAEDSGRTIEPPVSGSDYRAGRAPGESR